MGAPVILRPATVRDAPALADLMTASWQDSYAGLLPAAFLRDHLPALHRADWAAVMKAPPDGAVFLAEDASGPAGVVAVWLRGPQAYIDHLHLRPGERGRGLGRRLLATAVRDVAARGATRAALKIISGNDGAARFYARLGGVAGPPETVDLHGVRLDCVPYEWAKLEPLLTADQT